ncbi:50S ribosomal protein L6 [Candidatus Woesearchaeota archaeon]|nr:50S ribosomal protein L6 [Candidatus Woesearchaeota archaeon]
MKTDLKEELSIPENVEVKIHENIVIKGKKGEISYQFRDPRITIALEEGKIVLKCPAATKRDKKRLYTFVAHIKNMLKGVTEVHHYELKVCAAHFPMNVAVVGNELVIKNFLGENAPRKLTIPGDVKTKVEGDIVVVESHNKESAGRTASQIELLTRVRHRDRRIFQDGIFITNKCGKTMQ